MTEPASPAVGSPRRAVLWALVLGAMVISVVIALAVVIEDQPWTHLESLSGALLGGLVAVALVAYVARVVRWRIISAAMGWPLSWRDATVVYVGAFAFGATPGRMGELVRVEMMRRRAGTPWHDTALMMVLDRVTDLISVAALALGPFVTPFRALIAAMSAALAVLAWGTDVRKRKLRGWLLGVAQRVRPTWREDLARAGERLGVRAGESDYRVLLQPGMIAVAVGLATVAWVAEGLAFHWLLIGLGLEVDVLVSVSIYTAATLAGALSMLPGGLGGFEVTATGLLVAVGAGVGVAIAAVTVIRLVTFWFSIVLGLAMLPAALRPAAQTDGQAN